MSENESMNAVEISRNGPTVEIPLKEYEALKESKEKLLKERRERRETTWKLARDKLPRDGADILFAFMPTVNSTSCRIYHGRWDAKRFIWIRDNGEHHKSAFAWRYVGDLGQLQGMLESVSTKGDSEDGN